MQKQITDTVLLVRPHSFKPNQQTALNNYFQKSANISSFLQISNKAKQEFDDLADKLKTAGVNTIIVEDDDKFDTPDAVFSNNWISFHENGTVGVYPMFAENRRLERNENAINALERNGFL